MEAQREVERIIKVFVSYTQESSEHSSRVLKLSNALRGLGFECDIDQYHFNERWPKWMEERIEWADFVLVICTKTYLRRWNNDEPAGVGLGAQWESMLTRQSLYQSPNRNDKFVPIVFDRADIRFIPKPLSDVTRVNLGMDLAHLNDLRSRLLGIPPAEMPPVRTSLAPIAVAEGFFGNLLLVQPFDWQPDEVGIRQEAELIGSNLFPVSFPSFINKAKIKLKRGNRFDERLNQVLRQAGLKGKPLSDYYIEQGALYTFQGFDDPIWKQLFAARVLEDSDSFPTRQWAESGVIGEKSKFIKLLNRCLLHYCEHNDTPYRIEFSKKMHCHLFAAKAGQREGKLKAFALKSEASRTVYQAIPDKKSPDRDAIQHWQHQAFRHKFMRFGGEWYLVLSPFWAFTCDGISSPSKWQKRSSANMRKPERNRAVLGHVMFWASVLCREPGLFDTADGFRINRPVGLQISPSIKDSEWMIVAKQEEKDTLTADLEMLL